MTRARTDPWLEADVDRLGIFVPVIMSAGLLVSIVTILRDAVHWGRHRAGGAEVERCATAIATHVRTGCPAADVREGTLRSRAFFTAVALSAGTTAVYLAIGATANYLRPGGYVANIAWLWSLALLASALLGLMTVVAAAAAIRSPGVPRWARGVLLRTSLAHRPEPGGPPAAVSWALWGTLSLLVVLSLQVGWSPHLVSGFDERLFDAMRDAAWADGFGDLDLLGHTEVAVALAVAIGLATMRCPVFALTYVGAVGIGLGANNLLRVVVDRARPPGHLADLGGSYPSGHLVQMTLLTGFLAIAAFIWTRRRWVALVVCLVMSVAVVDAAIGRIAKDDHWPTDIAGGILLGVAVVLGGTWVLSHDRWHVRCHACPWREPSEARSQHTGLLPIRPPIERVVVLVARTWTLLALAGFAFLSLQIGLPRNPEGDSLGSQVEVPLQIALLLLVAVGLVLALRWGAVGASMLVVGGLGLAVVSAVQHPPWVAVAVAGVFVLPAIGLWVAWQHARSIRAIAVLAVVMSGLLAVTGAGAARVHDHFYGPAHPASALVAEPVDQVEWIWSGAVTETRAVVVARLAAGGDRVLLRLSSERGPAVVEGRVDSDEIATFDVDGLEGGTRYEYVIEVDGRADETRGRGTFATFESGAQSLTVAAGSCARTGSNGSVFDAIRGVDPDLYLAIGDIHYGNIAENDSDAFLGHFDRVLRAPAQAALYRSAPVAYVWDDHDYGPNDADAASPSRSAARAAYRQAVPHYTLPAGDDGPIHQAFTAGRVRFILTDTRSERTDSSMLGAAQLEWLESELRTASRTHALVVWVNPVPWIAPSDASRDDWGGFAQERQRIANVIAALGTDNLVMVSGDAHMVAIDDGTNSDFSTSGDGGFPVLHAAPLDRPGNVKGGPYSHGAFGGAGQFGTIEIRDTGATTVTVELTGHRFDGTVLTSLTTTVTVPEGAR